MTYWSHLGCCDAFLPWMIDLRALVGRSSKPWKLWCRLCQRSVLIFAWSAHLQSLQELQVAPFGSWRPSVQAPLVSQPTHKVCQGTLPQSWESVSPLHLLQPSSERRNPSAALLSCRLGRTLPAFCSSSTCRPKLASSLGSGPRVWSLGKTTLRSKDHFLQVTQLSLHFAFLSLHVCIELPDIGWE